MTRNAGWCHSKGYRTPTWQILSDRRGKALVTIALCTLLTSTGGRTAWSCTVVVQNQHIPARFWYDDEHVNNAREDAAEKALQMLGLKPSPLRQSSHSHALRGSLLEQASETSEDDSTGPEDRSRRASNASEQAISLSSSQRAGEAETSTVSTTVRTSQVPMARFGRKEFAHESDGSHKYPASIVSDDRVNKLSSEANVRFAEFFTNALLNSIKSQRLHDPSFVARITDSFPELLRTFAILLERRARPTSEDRVITFIRHGQL